MNLSNLLENNCGKEIKSCTNQEIYFGLLSLVNELASKKESNQNNSKKKVLKNASLLEKTLVKRKFIIYQQSF